MTENRNIKLVFEEPALRARLHELSRGHEKALLWAIRGTVQFCEREYGRPCSRGNMKVTWGLTRSLSLLVRADVAVDASGQAALRVFSVEPITREQEDALMGRALHVVYPADGEHGGYELRVAFERPEDADRYGVGLFEHMGGQLKTMMADLGTKGHRFDQGPLGMRTVMQADDIPILVDFDLGQLAPTVIGVMVRRVLPITEEDVQDLMEVAEPEWTSRPEEYAKLKNKYNKNRRSNER